MEVPPHSYDPFLLASVSPQLSDLVGDHESNVDFSFLDMPPLDDSIECDSVDPLSISLSALLDLPSMTSPGDPSCVVLVTQTSTTSDLLPTTTSVVVPTTTPSRSQDAATLIPQQAPLDKPKRKSSKIHECSECDFRTPNQKRLGNHMRDAHDIQAFQCPYCPVKVARYDNLGSHWKSCTGQPSTNRLAITRSNFAVKPKRTKRVSYKDLPPRCLTQPTSPCSPDVDTASLPPNEAPNSQPPPPITSRPPREDIDVGPTFDNSSTKTPADWAREVESLKSELELKAFECESWREEVRRLKRGVVNTKWLHG
ncbi:hypothetical protein TWF281_010385 [Arthrobotrys megalospora]